MGFLACTILKIENPSWPNIKVLWEASKEMFHLSLDIACMVPVIGEVADFVNGVIYTIEGECVNASLSFASMIPVAGWASTTLKYCKKTINIVSGSTIVGKTTLRWLKKAGNIIDFGDKNKLRRV